MNAWLRRWGWPLCKTLLALAILVSVGRQFARDLQHPELWMRPLAPGWLVASGLLYVLALGCWATVWYRLMVGLDQHPRVVKAARAYYLGHLGKYIPGKAWALVMRAALVAGPGVRASVAGLTAFYEVLTNMAGGALLAALLFLLLAAERGAAIDWDTFRGLFRLHAPDTALLDRTLLMLVALVLLAPIGTLVWPPVFNRLARRFTRPFRERDAAPLPHLPARLLLQGLALSSGSWFLLGLSLWAMVQGVVPGSLAWDRWGLYTAYMAVAYVAGFIIVLVPSGLGVREFFLTLFLTHPDAGLESLVGSKAEARALAVLIVLLLRLVWTTAEVVMAGVVYWLPTGPRTAPSP